MAFFDLNSQRSLANLLPSLLVQEMKLLWSGKNQPLLALQDYALITHMTRRGHPPEPLDQILRARFWFEFNRCQDLDDRNPHMTMAHILGRDIAKEVFYQTYIKNPYKLAFMLCPPSDYATALNLGLAASTAKLLEVVEKLKMFSEDGEIKPTAADKLMKINEFFHNRVQGIESKKSKKGKGVQAVIPEEVSPGELGGEQESMVTEDELEALERTKVDAFAKAKGGT